MPAKPRAEAASTPARIRLSPAERERVNEAARVNRQKFSQFARDAILNAAEECLESGDDESTETAYRPTR